MKTVQVLQLGENDFRRFMPVSDCAKWYYEPDLSRLPQREPDVVILDRDVTDREFNFLARYTRAYTLFVTDRVHREENHFIQQLIARRRGSVLSPEGLKAFLEKELPNYFPISYGEKLQPGDMSVAQSFQGAVAWRGFEGIDLSGDFGDEPRQIVFWRNDIALERNQAIDFWLEYTKDAGVEISLEIRVLYFQCSDDPESERVWVFSEKDLEAPVCIENGCKAPGRIFASLRAWGQGRLMVSALHYRRSRGGKGIFLPGGNRKVTSSREEVFYYFDPGDLRPPLNVYFAGYQAKEGFAGYDLMRELGHPFLLISEARLEGGAAYMGSKEYENMIRQIIRDHMAELLFRSSDVILSGISIGSLGALYYGCSVHPYAILVGKPLASFGNVAENERINRPGGFPMSLDVLHKLYGSLSQEAIDQLNHKFWDAFDGADWSGTQFAVAYMIEDDYDRTAYEDLQSHLRGTGVTIYGKGLHGRHHDDTPGIVSWFVDQYRRIIQENFENQ